MAYENEIFKCRCCGMKKKNNECSAEDISLCSDCNGDIAICLECKKEFIQARDLQVCDNCINKFDTDRLFADNDNNKVCALDFNESKSFRERYRI